MKKGMLSLSALFGAWTLVFVLCTPTKVNAQWQDPAPLPAPCPGEPTNDWGQCLADLDARVDYSTTAYLTCGILQFGTWEQCQTEYNANLGETQRLYNSCICSTLNTPAPWPVIDNSLSWCLEGCGQCDQADTPLNRFVCKMDCRSFCFANHPKQGGQGGGG